MDKIYLQPKHERYFNLRVTKNHRCSLVFDKVQKPAERKTFNGLEKAENDAAGCQADRDNNLHGAKQSCEIKLILSLHRRYQNGLDCKAPANTSGGQKAQPALCAPNGRQPLGLFSQCAFAIGSLPFDILHTNSATDGLPNTQKRKISSVLVTDPRRYGRTKRSLAIPVADAWLNKQRSFSCMLKDGRSKMYTLPNSQHFLFNERKKKNTLL